MSIKRKIEDYDTNNGQEQPIISPKIRKHNEIIQYPCSNGNQSNKRKIENTFTELSLIADTEIKYKQCMNGFIEEIKLKNFKCHDYFVFKFHPYVNFILGRNGSGKSAIIDAVILGLGGKTLTTGRLANLKSFIKSGHEKAEISLTLKNEGSEAFRPSIYGSRITIERKINSDGTNKYKLYDENHKLISTKKQELECLVDQFNIQVENPVCFLNQETSKNFLNSSNNTDKYKLFMKASQLDSMKKLQKEIEDQRQLSMKIVQDKKSLLPKLQEEVWMAEERVKKNQSLESLIIKQQILMNEYSWSMVINWEKAYEETKQKQKLIQKSKERLLEKLSESGKNHDHISKKFDQVRKEIDDYSIKSKSFKSDHFDNLANNLKKMNLNLRAREVEQSRLIEKYNKKKKSLNDLDKKFMEEQNNSHSNYDQERVEKRELIGKYKQKLKDLDEIEKTKFELANKLSMNIENLQKQLQIFEIDIEALEKENKSLQHEINKLENSTKDQLLKYGEFMPELLKDVQRYIDGGKFRQVPLGPIGNYIKPKNNDWALAIEQCIGAYMSAFVCGNHQDEAVLYQLFNRHIHNSFKRPRVIVTDYSSKLHDVNRFRPQTTQYSTVYEMIEFKDKIIANTLIDMRMIESVLLLPYYETGKQIIEKKTDKYCSEAYLQNGDKLLGHPTFRVYASRFRQAYYFGKDNRPLIENNQNLILSNRLKIDEKKAEMKSMTQKLDQDKMSKTKIDKELAMMKKEYFDLNLKLKDVESRVIPEPADLLLFEEEIDQLKNEIEGLKTKIGELDSDLSTLRDQYEVKRSEHEIYENEFKKHTKKIEELKERYIVLDQELSCAQEALEYYKKLNKKEIDKENEINETIAHQKSLLTSLIKQAESMCPRLYTRRMPDDIDREISAIGQQIELAEKEDGNFQQINDIYVKLRKKYENIEKLILKQSHFLKKLEKSLHIRNQKLQMFIESQSLKCNMDFQDYLRSRNYHGRLDFDHVNLTLDVVVHTNRSKSAKISKDTKSLSGGERSFSTVALLLALWSTVDSPILFLDEFDVFMDQINRNYAIELILNAARSKLNSQYVFLTPQDMGNQKGDEFVKIFKMPDPKRSI